MVKVTRVRYRAAMQMRGSRSRLALLGAGSVLAATVAVGLALNTSPARGPETTPGISSSASPGPATSLPTADDGLPIVVDAEHAVALALIAASGDGSSGATEGPFQIRHQPGAYWLVDVDGGDRYFVGTLSGDVIPEKQLTALGSEEVAPSTISLDDAAAIGDAAADAALGAGTHRVSFSIWLRGQPAHEFWCGQYRDDNAGKHYLCVDLVTGDTEKLSPSDLAPDDEASEAVSQLAILREQLESARAGWELILTLGEDERLVAHLSVEPNRLDKVTADFVAVGVDISEKDPDWGYLTVTGPWPDVLKGIDEVDPLTIQYDEDRTAMRPLAPPSYVVLPDQGAPYDAWPAGLSLPRDGAVTADETLVDRMADEVARALRPLGGDPYERISASLSCADAGYECRFSVEGVTDFGVDRYLFLAKPETWMPELSEAQLHSIDRTMEREAERIARSDADAARLIGTYETFHDAMRLIDQPRVVELIYRRPAGWVARGFGPVAVTQDDNDYLMVFVDLSSRSVVEIHERLYGAVKPSG